MSRSLTIFTAFTVFVLTLVVIIVLLSWLIYIQEMPELLPDISYNTKCAISFISVVPFTISLIAVTILLYNFLKKQDFKQYINSIVIIAIIMVISAVIFRKVAVNREGYARQIKKEVHELLIK